MATDVPETVRQGIARHLVFYLVSKYEGRDGISIETRPSFVLPGPYPVALFAGAKGGGVEYGALPLGPRIDSVCAEHARS